MIFNKYQLNCYIDNFEKIAKYYITQIKINIRKTYKTLTYLQICILTIQSEKTSFKIISKFYLVNLIAIWYIYDKITILF